MTFPAVPTRRRRLARRPETLADLLTIVGTQNGVANIIMQLSLPPVGHGVRESRVVSGSPRRYPMKRVRTTSLYLALAVEGSDRDRAVMREEVGKVHRAVHSTPESPVRYSGNSPDLQMWVAACLFRYYLDQYTMLYGEMSETELDTLTRNAAPLGTGLNVRPDAWPQSWAEFTAYWESKVPELAISPEIRHEFETLAGLDFLAEAWGAPGAGLKRIFGPVYHFMTRATLPQEFRDLMGWEWSDADQRRFERVLRMAAPIDPLLNPIVMRLIYRAFILDFRVRGRLGLPVLGTLRVSDLGIKDGGGIRRLAARWAA